MSVEITEEAMALADQMIEVLKEATTAVARQQAIELLMVGHAIRMSGPREPMIVIDGMAKHAKQLAETLLQRGRL